MKAMKLCECGCGQPSPIARITINKFGYKKGESLRFIHNHHGRGKHWSEKSKEKNREAHLGKRNGMWKGDKASKVAGQMRAQRIFNLDKCELCAKPAIDRHHQDDNTLNNDPLNVQILCRSCHMVIDGRMNNLRNQGGKKCISSS
jgi:hypothetical protein